MALMMDVSSNVRERLLEVLCTCTSDELELSRRAHIYSCSVHARKMAQILSHSRHLDARLSFTGYEGKGQVDGFHWRG